MTWGPLVPGKLASNEEATGGRTTFCVALQLARLLPLISFTHPHPIHDCKESNRDARGVLRAGWWEEGVHESAVRTGVRAEPPGWGGGGRAGRILGNGKNTEKIPGKHKEKSNRSE